MNSFLTLLFKMGISVASTDRDLFVNRFSETIQHKMDMDPEHAEQIGDDILAALDGLNQYLEIEQSKSQYTSQNQIDKESVKALTAAIEALNQTLKNK